MSNLCNEKGHEIGSISDPFMVLYTYFELLTVGFMSLVQGSYVALMLTIGTVCQFIPSVYT